MLPLELRVERHVDVPRDLAYAWWTQYTSHDHDALVFLPFNWKSRVILERDAEGRVRRFRDEGSFLGRDTTYTSTLSYDPPQAVLEDSVGPMGSFKSSYAFFSTEDRGTRIVWTIRGHVEPLWARLAARVPGLPEAAARLDLRGHATEMERDLHLVVKDARARGRQLPG